MSTRRQYFHDILQVSQIGSYASLSNEGNDIQIRFFDMNHNVVVADGIYRLHTHLQYEMIFVDQGTYSCLVDNQQLQLQQWDMLIVQPGQRHKDLLSKGTSYYAFHFNFYPKAADVLPVILFAPGLQPHEQIVAIENPEYFMNLIELMEQEDQSDTEGGFTSYRIHSAIFNIIFYKAISLYSSGKVYRLFSQKMHISQEADRLYAIFTKHLQGMPTLQQLCMESHLSKSALHRLCRELFNKPPCKAFMTFKIMHIHEYMKSYPDLSIKMVSDRFGFKNPFHFSRVFRKVMGFYPKRIRDLGRHNQKKPPSF